MTFFVKVVFIQRILLIINTSAMKIKILISVLFLFHLSCKNTDKEKSLDNKEIQVEKNLMKSVYIEGDTTWTISDRMKHYGVPGVSLAVIQDHKIIWSKTYGVMDKESLEPVTKKTLFQAGSISKPVAAYGALRLVDEKVIDANDNINTYLSSWKLPENEFTDLKSVNLKHLLSHTGGVTVHGFLGYSPDLEVPSLIQVLNGESPANSAAIFVDKLPEESFRYSGGGYTVMQQMMIDIKKMPYPDAMKELVLDPLKMLNSTYEQPLTGEELSKAATGYLPDGSMTKGKRHTYPEMAAAGLWTTSEDLALFAIDVQKTYAGMSENVLSKEVAHEMLEPFVEDFIGLGLFIMKMGEATYFGHGGWDEGFSSELVAHKDDGYGVVVLTNSNHPDFISELIRSVAFTYEWENFVPVFEKMKLNQEELDANTGRFKFGSNDLIEVFAEDGDLFARKLGESADEMVKISDSTYMIRNKNEPIQFALNSKSGEFEMLNYDPFNGSVVSSAIRMHSEEFLPFEYLVAGKYQEALKGYQEIFLTRSDDPAVNEDRINRKGYDLISKKNVVLARDLFKINTELYPESFNVYDSYAEACMLLDQYDLAVENYTKSLELNPKNQNAVEMIEKMQEMK